MLACRKFAAFFFLLTAVAWLNSTRVKADILGAASAKTPRAMIEQPFFCKFVHLVSVYFWNVRYRIPVSHSSLSSTRTAVTSLNKEASFGNRLATRVRRFSSRFCLSSILVARIRLRCSLGMPKIAKPSARFGFRPPGQLRCRLLITVDKATEFFFRVMSVGGIEYVANIIRDLLSYFELGGSDVSEFL